MKCSCQILMLLICTMVLLFNCQFYGMISYTLNLGCTDTPFLVSCWCWTRVGHRNGYDSPDSGFRRVSSFFLFFVSPTRADAVPTRLRCFRHASSEEKKKISAYFGSFRLFRPISAEMKISSDTRFWLKKKKKKKIKIKIKILPPPSGFRAFLPPHLLLNFGLFFFLFFFFFFWFRSATWLPLLLYLCVLAVLHLCLEFRL